MVNEYNNMQPKSPDTDKEHIDNPTIPEYSEYDMHNNYKLEKPTKKDLFSSTTRLIIKTVLMLVVFYVFSTIFAIILIGANIEAFKGEISGIFRSINGYGSALATGLGGALSILLLKKSGRIPIASVLIILLYFIPTSIYTETDGFKQKASNQFQLEKQNKGEAELLEIRQSIRTDFNTQGEFYYPKNNNTFKVTLAEWKIRNYSGGSTEVKSLELELIRMSDNAELSISYSKFRAEPRPLNTLDSFTTQHGIEFLRKPISSGSTSSKMYLVSSSNNIENKITISYDSSIISHSEAKQLAFNLVLISPESITLNQKICNHYFYDELQVCGAKDF